MEKINDDGASLFTINNIKHLLKCIIKFLLAGKIFYYVRSLTSKYAVGDNTYKSLDPLGLTHKKEDMTRSYL